jgi:hypothetical protein
MPFDGGLRGSGSFIEKNKIEVLNVADPPGVYSFPLRILKAYWEAKRAGGAYPNTNSIPRVGFSLCGQIVKPLILSVPNIRLYRPQGSGR